MPAGREMSPEDAKVAAMRSSGHPQRTRKCRKHLVAAGHQIGRVDGHSGTLRLSRSGRHDEIHLDGRSRVTGAPVRQVGDVALFGCPLTNASTRGASDVGQGRIVGITSESAIVGTAVGTVRCTTQHSASDEEIWSLRSDSNRRPAHYECAALPTELPRRLPTIAEVRTGMNPASTGPGGGESV